MTVNLSDIAAMGGWPVFSLVTLALPADMEVTDFEELYEGIATCGKMAAAMIIGGDTVRSDTPMITIAVFGRAEKSDEGEPQVLRRSAAEVGDVIAVTGPLGDSAAGYLRLQEGAADDDDLVSAHVRPRAQLAAGAGAIISGIKCGIDISDGLLQDLGHICKASNVGAVVRAADVPMSDALRQAYPEDALRLACTGGEDYELLLVGPEARVDELFREMDMEGGAIIGEIVKDNYGRKARVVDENEREVRFPRPGWDAFKS
jgi:thiamine-monophosphate kinase